jgi:GT2 family glycosyltransferase
MTGSVCIATCRRPEQLTLCLDALLCQTEPPDEIIISDAGGDAETRAVIETFRRRQETLIVHCPTPRTALPWQRWWAFEHCSGSGAFALFLDDDIRLSAQALALLRQAYRAAPDIAGAGFTITYDAPDHAATARAAAAGAAAAGAAGAGAAGAGAAAAAAESATASSNGTLRTRWLGITSARPGSITPGGITVDLPTADAAHATTRGSGADALDAIEVDWLSGGAMSFRREVLTTIGPLAGLFELYDARIGKAEDAILSSHARRHGRLLLIAGTHAAHPALDIATRTANPQDGFRKGLLETWGRAHTLRWLADANASANATANHPAHAEASAPANAPADAHEPTHAAARARANAPVGASEPAAASAAAHAAHAAPAVRAALAVHAAPAAHAKRAWRRVASLEVARACKSFDVPRLAGDAVGIQRTLRGWHRIPARPDLPSHVTDVMFFWDYDTQWGADRSRLPGPRDWGHLEFPNTDELLDLHAQFGIPACFAVVGAAALPGTRPYHDPAQVRRIHAAGHEIASHGFKHEWLPALDRHALLRTLRDSKDALEQCIGARVVSFVPPFNQPFDFARAGSISLAERREAGAQRTTLRRLCDALAETGYQFCRVAYAPLPERVGHWLGLGRAPRRPASPVRIGDITCVRIGPCGFDLDRVNAMSRTATNGAPVVLYGHPHSLHAEDATQSIHALRRVLDATSTSARSGAMRCVLPSQVAS